LKNNYPFLVLILFSIPLFFIAVRDTHSWGDDYAQYIKEAQNIASGKPYYESGYIYNKANPEYAPPFYPPGFPLMLAPLVKASGIAIRPMLYLISFLTAALMFILFFYFSKYTSTLVALCLSVTGVYCAGIMDMKGYVLSDIPSIVFTSLYLLWRNEQHFSNKRITGLVLAIFMAVLIRTQAAVILVAECLVLIQHCRVDFLSRSFSISGLIKSAPFKIIAGFIILYIPVMALLFPSPYSSVSFYLNFLNMYNGNFWGCIAFNINYLNDLLKSMFQFSTTNQAIKAFLTLIAYFSYAFALVGFFLSVRKKAKVDDYFFLLMCLMILVLPVHQGLRYLLPVLPVFLLYIYYSSRLILPIISGGYQKSAGVILTALYLLFSTEHYSDLSKPLDWTPYTGQDNLAFEYIRKNIHKDDIIVFAKPRALNLYTGARSMVIAWQKGAIENKKVFDGLGVKYLLKKVGVDEDHINRYLETIPPASVPLEIAETYSLYTLR
jgi:hypothetical protein